MAWGLRGPPGHQWPLGPQGQVHLGHGISPPPDPPLPRQAPDAARVRGSSAAGVAGRREQREQILSADCIKMQIPGEQFKTDRN